MTYYLKPNNDVDLVWVGVDFYNSQEQFLGSYTQPASHLKKDQAFKINDIGVIIYSSSALDNTPKTAKVFVRAKNASDKTKNKVFVAKYYLY